MGGAEPAGRLAGGRNSSPEPSRLTQAGRAGVCSSGCGTGFRLQTGSSSGRQSSCMQIRAPDATYLISTKCHVK